MKNNYSFKGIQLACLLSFTILSIPLYAQRDEQLWLDFQLDYPFANQYLLETTASYQTLLSKEDKWRSLSLTPTFEFLAFRRFDFLLNVPMAYTLQTTDVNSFEMAPSLGIRFHISQGKRINARLIYKLEERFFYQMETKDWETSNRSRLKGEVWISINGPNLFTDKVWYAILDYEEYFVTDQQLDERYANRRRGRIGAGYRLDYKNRFELIYTRQSSRNEIEGEYISNDNVFQLRYKIFLNPAKPVTTNR
jgi:hypothetical protein